MAARGGARTRFGYGSDVEHLERFGWYQKNSGQRIHVPRELLPGLHGLFDLHGNLFEWTHDWYESFDAALVTDPLGPPRGTDRVYRGGCWDNAVAGCRSAYRNYITPANRTSDIGIRLALSPSGVSGQAEPVEAAAAEASSVGKKKLGDKGSPSDGRKPASSR